ncbi:MAG: PDZ domain-containing protein, partial [Syntrophobacterales bacterium]
LGLADASGVVITQVASGSPAEEAGMQAGDIVRQVNRSRISSLEEYRSVMSRAVSGDSVLVLIQRGTSKFFAVIRK